jgi:hypothetical protein
MVLPAGFTYIADYGMRTTRASCDRDDRGCVGGAVEYNYIVFYHHLIIHHVALNAHSEHLNIHAHFLFVHVTACFSAAAKAQAQASHDDVKKERGSYNVTARTIIHIFRPVHHLSFLTHLPAGRQPAVLWAIARSSPHSYSSTFLALTLTLCHIADRQACQLLPTTTPQSLLSCSLAGKPPSPHYYCTPIDSQHHRR